MFLMYAVIAVFNSVSVRGRSRYTAGEFTATFRTPWGVRKVAVHYPAVYRDRPRTLLSVHSDFCECTVIFRTHSTWSVGRSVGRFVRWFVHSFLWNPLPSHDNISTIGLYDNTATNIELTKLCDHTFVNRRGIRANPTWSLSLRLLHSRQSQCDIFSIVPSDPGYLDRPKAKLHISSVQHFTPL